MDLGFSIRDLVSKTRRESDAKQEEETPDVCTGDILGGRRRSIFQIAGAIRTGVRLSSITQDTANRSKFKVFFKSLCIQKGIMTFLSSARSFYRLVCLSLLNVRRS